MSIIIDFCVTIESSGVEYTVEGEAVHNHGEVISLYPDLVRDASGAVCNYKLNSEDLMKVTQVLEDDLS